MSYRRKFIAITKWAFVLILVLLQFSRILLFVAEYGGLIQDSGWSLGIARSLAERGSYTTMVATIPDPAVRAGLSLQGDFHIQDEAGRLYFRSDRPALIIPQALIFKLFGFSFWSYRAGSLLFFLIFLVVASLLLWRVAGLGAVFLFHLLLYFYPHLLIYLSFQTLGEMTALAYTLLAFALFGLAAQKESGRRYWFFAGGVAAGLALYSKLIAALALSGLGWLGLWLLYQRRMKWSELFALAGGGLLFPVVWELVQLIAISRLAGFGTYLGHINHRYHFFQNYGRGLDDAQAPPLAFMVDKLQVITEISQPNLGPALLTGLVILVGGGYLLWYWRAGGFRFNIIFLFWSGWLIHYLWFVLRSTGGVTRYNWLSLMLGVLALAVVVAFVMNRLWQKRSWPYLAVSLALLGLLFSNLWAQRLAARPLISDQLIEFWRQKHVYSPYIQMPSMIIPSQAQAEVIDYIDHLPPEHRIFYALGYHNGEIATQTGRIFYPLERRTYMSPRPGDVVIINPGIISSWRKPPDLEAAILAEVKQRCPNIIFRNDYYILCGLE